MNATIRFFVFLLIFGLASSVWAANPKAHIKTNMGEIVLELYPDKAPKTVENFIQYANADHYDGTVFHRVIKNFMIQGGGYTEGLKLKPTRAPIKNEADNALKNKRGTIAMARTQDPHSATAQFFINVKDNTFLNFKAPIGNGWGYAVFGKVVKGMNVVEKIENTQTGSKGPFPGDVPQKPVIIEDVIIKK